MKKILVPTSGAASAYESAEFAMQIAKTIGAEIHVLYIVADSAEAQTHDQAIKVFELASEEFEIRVRGSIGVGEIVDEIIKYAETHDINLVLMGASYGKVVEEWLSHDVLGHTTVPVLVMPYQLFATTDQSHDSDMANSADEL